MFKILIRTAQLSVLAVFFSCSRPSPVDKAGMETYLNKSSHHLAQQSSRNGIDISLKYMPQSMLVLQDLSKTQDPGHQALDTLQKKYASQYYFLLSFSKEGKEAIRQLGDYSLYSKMLQTLAFRMNEYVNITTASNDTVQLSDYAFQQTYGLSDANSLLLAFPAEKIRTASSFHVNIAECGFATGSERFEFKSRDIANIPELDIQNIIRQQVAK
ncbi:hypothetical protein [Chitinophaga sp. HK235]|uniref:hypothetical protein n=1 Tax=Chitinophaga sp. HK235 TaxID=2952571 RepID=UPI001BA559AB|nr:hypothetical protein [Chitinophaga sp. HK235]